MDLFGELQGLFLRYRFRPKRKLSQHFCVNQAFLEKMASLAGLGASDTVLEIGPGTGFLTRELLKRARVVAVEADEGLCGLLGKELSSDRLELLCGDFLEADLPDFNKVVCLPPYSHSKELMLKLLEHDFELGLLVFQREFAEKLVALPGFKEYSALSVLVQFGFEARVLESVPSGFFFPKPKAESCLVSLKSWEKFGSVSDWRLFSLFVRTVFRFQNKNLRNALGKGGGFLLPSFGLDFPVFEERAASLPFLDKKVNLLEVGEFVSAFNRLC